MIFPFKIVKIKKNKTKLKLVAMFIFHIIIPCGFTNKNFWRLLVESPKEKKVILDFFRQRGIFEFFSVLVTIFKLCSQDPRDKLTFRRTLPFNLYRQLVNWSVKIIKKND